MLRLIEVLVQLTSQLLNLSEIGGQLGFDHKTADRYIASSSSCFSCVVCAPGSGTSSNAW